MGSEERAPPPRRRETAKLTWNTKPKKAPNARDLEFQPAEVVFPNKAPSGRAEQTELLVPRTPEGEVDDRKLNRLIWGDNLLAMQALLAQGYEGQIQLIYIDPPFLSSADYSHRLRITGKGDVVKAPSIIERLAYKDTWHEGIDSYLDMLYPRLGLMRELLTDNGSLYVHIGPEIAPYVRVMMDEIFGRGCFINQIAWRRSSPHGDANRWGNNHDVILYYGKSPTPLFNRQFAPHNEETEGRFNKRDQQGRLFKLVSCKGPGMRGSKYEWKGKVDVWRYSLETMAAMDAGGELYYSAEGWPYKKLYLDDSKGLPIQDFWDDIPNVRPGKEHLGFETQKPEALLERIINASSALDSLVSDFFCGSGTTAATADRLGRRWIATDLSKVGVQVTRCRLVEQGASPFVIENIGNYQRELIYREGGNITLMQRIIMRLFEAEQHPNHSELGVKEEKGSKVLVYVGYPDRPLTARKTAELVKLARNLDGQGYDRLILLGWDYEYNYDEQIEIRRKGFGVQIEPRLIPPSIYEFLKKSRDEADLREKFASKIHFAAKPYLKITQPKADKRGHDEYNVSFSIDRYVLTEIPVDDEREREELLKVAKGEKFSVLIDYWAVDWEYDGKTFRSRWQDFRGNGKDTHVVSTRANTTLKAGRKYDIAVRVVDVFGNDATATTSVDLR